MRFLSLAALATSASVVLAAPGFAPNAQGAVKWANSLVSSDDADAPIRTMDSWSYVDCGEYAAHLRYLSAEAWIV